MAENPLRKLKVRQALSLAINRDGIKSQIMDGFAAPSGQLLPEGAVGYTPDLKPDPYDPDRAKALLAEAGYPQGFQLTLAGTNDRYVNDKQIVEAIAQMWTRIGVKTAVNATPASVFFSEVARRPVLRQPGRLGQRHRRGQHQPDPDLRLGEPGEGPRRRSRGRRISPATDIDAVIEQSLATFDPEERGKRSTSRPTR